MPSRVLVALRVAAPPERAFQVFTRDIGEWWQPNDLFAFTRGKTGRLAFEPGHSGRLIETYADGSVFEVGRIRVWQPPRRLVLSWRQASFTTAQETEVRIRFDPVGDGTRVTVEHLGWDAIPQGHSARHGFPLGAFQARHAEWWQRLLASFRASTP